MLSLYYLAQIHGYLVVGTGNKIEDFGIGFFTKYGDGGVDINPVADLLKTEVYKMAEGLNIIKSICDAAPTDGLFGEIGRASCRERVRMGGGVVAVAGKRGSYVRVAQ